MKKLTILLAILIPSISWANDNEITVKSKVKNVTVFIQGAQINRSGYVTVPKGNSTLVFDALENSINRQSIQATGKGKFTILDVQYRYQYPKPSTISQELPDNIQKQINRWTDTTLKLNFQMSNIRAKKAAIQKEHQLILNHPLVQGRTKSDSLELLIGTVKYIQVQLVSIADRMYNIQWAENKLTKRQNTVNQKIQELRNYNNNKPKPAPSAPKHQVLVHIYANAATNGSCVINYNVLQAGWSPMYDIKATSFSKPIQLVYKASIYQNTGIDWKGVKLTFSNSNPNQGSTKPTLPVWYINYYVHVQRTVQNLSNVSVTSAKRQRYFKEKELSEDADFDDAEVKALATNEFTQKITNFSSVEFKVDIPFNVPTGGQRRIIMLKNHELEGKYKHYVVPKLDKNAFVTAQITGWEDLNLLVGSANVYFGGTLVGKTVVDPTMVEDTLLLSLGRDRNVNISRKLKDSETKTPMLSGNKVHKSSFEIEIKNRHNTPLDITVEDHIPFAQNKEIEVELTKKAGTKLEEGSGLISWEIKLPAYGKKKWSYEFMVTYPKDKTVIIR